ncbi:hypothetical protein T03_4767, partial [Trichinella britovi]
LDKFKIKLLDTAVNCTCKSSAYFRYYALVADADRANNSIPPDNEAEEGEATVCRLGLENQRNPPVSTGLSPISDECANNAVEEVNESA